MNPSGAGLELRDIHLPPAPSWWPPAPGWWLLAALALACLAFAGYRLRRHLAARRWRRRVRAELDRIAAAHRTGTDPAALAAAVSQLLRRVTRLLDPGAVAARDEEWLAFLDRRLGADAKAFRNGVGRALVDAPYRRADDAVLREVDAGGLIALARDWLDAALPRERRDA